MTASIMELQWILAAIVSISLLITGFLHLVWFKKKNFSELFQGKHVVITGGSQGLGKELALRFFQNGARVTIIARTRKKLELVKSEFLDLKKAGDPSSFGTIEIVDADVKDAKAVDNAMKEAVEVQNQIPIHTLICCAGVSVTGYFLDIKTEAFADQFQTNYMGTVIPIKAVVPEMIKHRIPGKIVVTTSAIVGASFIGYIAYAPTKSALRSFADGLRNELIGFGISVHVAYPPDMDTPGFIEENKTKPEETLKISPPSVYSASRCADSIVEGLLRGEYHIYPPDVIQWFLLSTMANVTPRGPWAAMEILLSPLVSVFCIIFNIFADTVSYQYGRRILASRLAKETK